MIPTSSRRRNSWLSEKSKTKIKMSQRAFHLFGVFASVSQRCITIDEVAE